jgi:hypothetical protein
VEVKKLQSLEMQENAQFVNIHGQEENIEVKARGKIRKGQRCEERGKGKQKG